MGRLRSLKETILSAFRLTIKSNQQNLGTRVQTSKRPSRAPYSLILQWFRQPGISLFIGFFALLGFASYSRASLFSVIGIEEAVAQEISIPVENSQTLALMSPNASSLSVSEPAMVHLVVDNGALLSTIGPLGTEADTVEHENIEEDISFYIVEKGDSISMVAEMFDVTVETIRWANDIPAGKGLKVGDTLVVPPVSGVIHEVVKGDTISSIAKKYGATISKIGGWNSLENDSKLSIGQTIIVPDGKIIAKPVVKKSSSGSSSASSSIFSKIPGLSEGKIGGMLRRASGPDLGSYFARPCGGACRRTQGSHGNGTSVDLGGKMGTPVVAAASGKIIIARGGWNMGYGNYIVIQHPNGTQSIYGHLGQINVSVGQEVSQNETIGLLGNSGRSTGPHLHFEIRGAKNPLIKNPSYGL